MAKKVNIVAPISESVKRAQIREKTYQGLEAIASTSVEAKRTSLAELEAELAEISAQAEIARERVSTMLESLGGGDGYINGHGQTEEAQNGLAQ